MKQKTKFKPFVVSIICLITSLHMAGCAASAGRLERLRVGMTRDDVTKAIGRPRSTTAQAGTEVLLYQFTDKPFGDGMIFPGTYYVHLTQGRVVGWSRDEMKDEMDRERAYRMNSAALAPPKRVNVQHSGYINQDLNVHGNINQSQPRPAATRYLISPDRVGGSTQNGAIITPLD